MNKKELANILKSKMNYSYEECLEIMNIIEKHFSFGNKNSEVIKNELSKKLNISKEESERINFLAYSIIIDGLSNSMKHPFRNKE